RWTPSTAAWRSVGTAPAEAGSFLTTLDGVVATQVEAWEPVGSIVVGAWWLVPTARGYDTAEMPTTPCTDPGEALDVGSWSSMGVLDTPEGRFGVWLVASWLGPTAVIAAPF